MLGYSTEKSKINKINKFATWGDSCRSGARTSVSRRGWVLDRPEGSKYSSLAGEGTHDICSIYLGEIYIPVHPACSARVQCGVHSNICQSSSNAKRDNFLFWASRPDVLMANARLPLFPFSETRKNFLSPTRVSRKFSFYKSNRHVSREILSFIHQVITVVQIGKE